MSSVSECVACFVENDGFVRQVHKFNCRAGNRCWWFLVVAELTLSVLGQKVYLTGNHLSFSTEN
jgi:hypothetical protein